MAMAYYPCLMYPWTPWIVEPDFGQERFIVDDPGVLFREGNFNRANVISGITADEFISPAGVVSKKMDFLCSAGCGTSVIYFYF